MESISSGPRPEPHESDPSGKSFLLNSNFNNLFPFTHTFLKPSLILSCPDQNILHKFYLVHACYQSCPSVHISSVVVILIGEDSNHFITTDILRKHSELLISLF
jgi:hypothetical protein